MKLFETYGIGMALDVGANTGQYAEDLRRNGFCGRIVSFEPLKSAFQHLAARAANDPLWGTRNMALGAVQGKSTIHVAGNSTSSSLLKMLPSHEAAAPESRYTNSEEIMVETLDSIWASLETWTGNVWLKVDTQGYEAEVLKGAEKTMARIACVQLEMSLQPLYEGSEAFEVLLARMIGMGYRLVGLQPGFTDNNTGVLLQVDGIFHRE